MRDYRVRGEFSLRPHTAGTRFLRLSTSNGNWERCGTFPTREMARAFVDDYNSIIDHFAWRSTIARPTFLRMIRRAADAYQAGRPLADFASDCGIPMLHESAEEQ
ncbi:MAG: hypothetical protein IT175_12205 [Acidobacteria bacterium]|nr:hypothetical protein [Acidobacteriota bacterium]